ncbi:hypothetical protein MNEG_12097 [Monoraphidium neglectum]|uniref:Uncharacterized protein n=1 Tax=Monoraphidium neglectum TaxID=145388 RepID=A0A0D2M3D7_9CHLO|nr:hypothetical protein MNEG_12097 [Monoraphidium neglectum]KIY95866.1 hypothetical protein MNEG_12097 [Monoraphidium neglectum]|eukprot:XP_013894886.1 hypothetical protein MNEG_12097 [Monoraphidium neglectum]
MPQQGRGEQRDAAADKLLCLLGYLDSVEQEAEGEAAAAAVDPAPPRHTPAAAAAPRGPQTAAAPGARACGRGSAVTGEVPAENCGDAGGNRSAALAESVFDGVRARLRRLEQEVAARDAALAAAEAAAAERARAHAAELLAARARGAKAAAAARGEGEAAAARQLAFIDRLMADKDDLTRALAAAGEASQASEARYGAAIAALKEGWAGELRRQREGWAAAERARRDAWAEGKAAEIKALTVKDQDDAVERERAAAAARLGEACQRYEQQMQVQRLRLVADAELKLEAAEAAWRDDKRRAEEAAAAAAEALRALEGRLGEEAARISLQQSVCNE